MDNLKVFISPFCDLNYQKQSETRSNVEQTNVIALLHKKNTQNTLGDLIMMITATDRLVKSCCVM